MTKPQDHHPDDAGAEGGGASGPQPPQYRRPGDTPTGDGAGQPGANPWGQPGTGPSAQESSGQWGQAGAGHGTGASQQWGQQNPYGGQGQGGQWQGQGYNNQGYGGPNYGNQGYPEQGYAGQGGQWQSQGYAPQGYPEQPEEKSNGRNILIIVLLIMALLAAAGFAAFWFTGSPGEGKSSDQTTASSTEGTDARGSEDEDADAERGDRDDEEEANREEDDEDTDDEAEADSRPKNPTLPVYATPVNASARGSNSGGDLNSVWKSGPTSDSFALAVRDAYVDAYLDGDEDDFNHVVEAYSAVTGTSYTMSCRDNGEYVHCTGGNNANVYIA